MNAFRYYGITILTLGILLTVIILGPAMTSVQANDESPYLYPYNQSTNVSFDIDDVTQAWNEWKSADITSNNAGGDGRLRVLGGVDDSSTVSEGQGYGILFASLFDDQETLDGLWLFTRDHLNDQGLMHWHIGAPGEIRGNGAATDGDEDIAMGMVNACIKVQQGAWSASPAGLDYCQIAEDLIDALYEHTVDKPGSSPAAGLPNNQGGELIPGDEWNLSGEYPDGIVNLSYFAPGYYTVFGKFTNNVSGWENVNDRNYEITDLAQNQAGNCSGLVPNWVKYNGEAQVVPWQPENYSWWSWDAARFAWRIAVDQYWYDTANSRETMNEIGGFFSSVGIQNVNAQYRMDGTSVDSYRSTFFVGNAAAAVWAAPDPQAVNCGAATGSLQSTPQQAYDAVLATKDTPNSYYSNAWRLLSMLLITGNFPNFYEMADGSTPNPTNTTPLDETPVPPTETPTPFPTTPTSIPADGCAVDYTITDEWNGGFVANMTITNSGSAVDGWTLAWDFPDGQQISNGWNATIDQSGASVTATNVGWNTTIPEGGSVSFGFQGTNNGSNAAPSAFTLNDQTCTIN
ncbi:MAG: glycosyl hydrolase family 8 [Chloroflexota bacterium]